jgi:hypothetical protein
VSPDIHFLFDLLEFIGQYQGVNPYPSGLMLSELLSSQASRSKAKTKGFIVIRASHKTIAGDACRNRKLLVIQQIKSLSNSIKNDIFSQPVHFLVGVLKFQNEPWLF